MNELLLSVQVLFICLSIVSLSLVFTAYMKNDAQTIKKGKRLLFILFLGFIVYSVSVSGHLIKLVTFFAELTGVTPAWFAFNLVTSILLFVVLMKYVNWSSFFHWLKRKRQEKASK